MNLGTFLGVRGMKYNLYKRTLEITITICENFQLKLKYVFPSPDQIYTRNKYK